MILKTITPAHVGSGNIYSSWEFVKIKDKIYRINFSGIFNILDEKKKEILLSDLEKEKNLEVFLEEQKIDIQSLIKKHPTIVKYSIICELNNVDKIREQIKTNNIPYIPGSSIKGAIREALIWYYTRNDENLQKLLRIVENDLRKRESKKYIGNNYIEEFFSLRKNRYDAKYDLMKFLEISDFMPENCKLIIKNVKTHSLRSNSLTQKHYNNFVESINGIFKGIIKISPQLKESTKNKKEYPLLEEKLHILGLNVDLNEEDMVTHLKKVLREFNEWCLNKEIELCKKAKKSDVFLKELNKIKSQNKEKNLLRIGFGIGTIYQTLIKLIEEKNKDLFYMLIDILELHGKKKRKRYLYGYNLRKIPYPKSIEFTTENKPIGWSEWED